MPTAGISETLDWRDHIVCDPDVLCGKPILKGTRLSVEFVLELLAAGSSHSEMLEDYPTLTETGIRAALAYAAERFKEDSIFLLHKDRA